MQIQTLEEKTGLDRATIRYYEREGLISPNRLQNGYRDYTDIHLQDLLKVKLLRQVGLSLDAIKQVIDGREVLHDVLMHQMDKIDELEACVSDAKKMCTLMLQDNVTYQTIEPERYFNAVNTASINSTKVVDITKAEIIYSESHPIRRFFGRYLDIMLISLILKLIIVVIMRLRPYTDLNNLVISLAAILLVIPINAVLLAIFGTTPGKFAAGIYLEDPFGKKLSFTSSIRREWGALKRGCGFYIPIYSFVRMIKSYRTHVNGLELDWDYDSDIRYKNWTQKRTIFVTVLLFVIHAMMGFVVADSQRPQFRSDALTMSQYASNYNDYALQNEMLHFLSPEGEWYTDENPHTVIVSLDESTENWNFIEDESGYLKRIEIEIETDLSLFYLSNGRPSLAVFTAIMSKPDGKLSVANKVVEDMQEIRASISQDISSGLFQYGEVTVKWETLQLQGDGQQHKLILSICMN